MVTQLLKVQLDQLVKAGNEMLDETLSYKSLNMRKSLIRFKKSEAYLNQDEAGVNFSLHLIKEKKIKAL